MADGKLLEKRYVTQTISLPVQECLSAPWPDFTAALRSCWRLSTDMANWASHTLRLHDIVRMPGMTELPRWSPPDLYALAFGRAKERPGKRVRNDDGDLVASNKILPAVAAQYDGAGWAGGKVAAATLLRKVARKYGQERGKVVWLRERRTPEFIYPYPFPVHRQAWLPHFDARSRPCVSLALAGGRFTVRLRCGPEYGRQVRLLRALADGKTTQQELSVCRQRTGGSHRRECGERAAGGAHRESYRIMLRMAIQVEVPAAPAVPDVAVARTGPDPFVALVTPDRDPWLLHAPWVRMWVLEHRQFLDQFADDLKYEKRWPGHKRRGLNRYSERRCEKHARRMQTFRQQTAAMVVGHAARRGCGRLAWDDSDRSFVPEFPWALLRTDLQNKCDEFGLIFDASGSVVDDSDPAVPDVTVD